jgi:hypothetical protein
MERGALFRASMIELGLLGFLVLVPVFSIAFLRRHTQPAEEEQS